MSAAKSRTCFTIWAPSPRIEVHQPVWTRRGPAPEIWVPGRLGPVNGCLAIPETSRGRAEPPHDLPQLVVVKSTVQHFRRRLRPTPVVTKGKSDHRQTSTRITRPRRPGDCSGEAVFPPQEFNNHLVAPQPKGGNFPLDSSRKKTLRNVENRGGTWPRLPAVAKPAHPRSPSKRRELVP